MLNKKGTLIFCLPMIETELLPVTVTSNIISSAAIFSNYLDREIKRSVMPLSLICCITF
ncbi:hypothetical protein PROSTU_04054 [Providencia stuartii ATCC 25827]|uniref:Uncharacterized protein n=1 Tax=Providencia stuartii ATCC 25827 TaxID=471874 RepID=A0AA86YX12_PROST|nr:hypothetical protein PROSTU_04054 [Providencia stuartii ATCC 25827]